MYTMEQLWGDVYKSSHNCFHFFLQHTQSELIEWTVVVVNSKWLQNKLMKNPSDLENNNSSICLCSLGSDRIALGGKDSFLRIF